ncbi:hypothetical protein B0H66DRAFT_613438 [Apodospora peruviana]|uniref:NACHT domain-containing protein n=1 Tax=Apodospora peruviana TaxID=516989 RepID=A0AAE0ITY1_9PEZI|nr:hypothetical protein B0H66DRAFT_613438 [Apodospora peruviana]
MKHSRNSSYNQAVRLGASKQLFKEWGAQTGLLPVPPAAAATTVLSQLLQDPGKQRAVHDILASIEQVFVNCDGLEKRYEFSYRKADRQPSNTTSYSIRRKVVWALRDEKKLEDLVSLLESFTDSLDKLLPVGSDDPGMTELGKRLDALRLGIDAEATARTAELVKSHEHQRNVDRYIRDSERRSVLGWLGAVSCDAELDVYIRDRVPSTCEWILQREEYRDWKSPSYATNAPDILWVYGEAGMGKSFISARDVRKREPLSILRSWLFQLASARMWVFEEVQKLRQGKEDREIVESELFSLFRVCLRRLGRCFLVIDGYDELSNELTPRRSQVEGIRETFLRELFRAVEGSQAHIILVSRDEVDIRRLVLDTEQSSTIAVRSYSIRAEETADDIASFCRHVIDTRLPKLRAPAKQEITEELSERCQGMLLWVRLSGAMLNRGRSTLQLKKDIGQTPVSLEEAYAKDVRRISALEPKEQERTLNILRWSLFAARPLSLAEPSEALAIDMKTSSLDRSELPEEFDEDYVEFQILRLCGSLVKFRPVPNAYIVSDSRIKQGTIHLTHFSVKEFLLSGTSFGGQLNQRDSHGILGSLCLHYLLSEDVLPFYQAHVEQFLPVESPSDMYNITVDKFESINRTLDMVYRGFKEDHWLLLYAVNQWFKHVRTYESLGGGLLPALELLIMPENRANFRLWWYFSCAGTNIWQNLSHYNSVLAIMSRFGLWTGARHLMERNGMTPGFSYWS